MKVARYSFSGSIPSKFERKLCRHKQTVRKITTSCIRYSPMKFVMIRVAMTSDRSCYNNKMTPLPSAVNLQQYLLALGTVLTKSFTGAFFLQYGRLDVREVKAESVRASVIEIFWDEDFIVRKLIR